MKEIMQNVTIFYGTRKRLATHYRIEPWTGSRKIPYRIRFKEKGARKRWMLAWGPGIMIVDGWDHPEFDFLIRGFQDAPVQELSDGVTFKTVSMTVASGEEPVKNKYELEFEAYIHTLEPSKILFKMNPH